MIWEKKDEKFRLFSHVFWDIKCKNDNERSRLNLSLVHIVCAGPTLKGTALAHDDTILKWVLC